MFYYIISTTYQKIGDLFCPVIFLDFRTVCIEVRLFSKVLGCIMFAQGKKTAGNQGNYQNFETSLLPKKRWLVFMEMKQIFFLKKQFQNGQLNKNWYFQNRQFSKIILRKFHGLAIFKISIFFGSAILNFFFQKIIFFFASFPWKFLGWQEWVEILIITLVSSCFLPWANIFAPECTYLCLHLYKNIFAKKGASMSQKIHTFFY